MTVTSVILQNYEVDKNLKKAGVGVGDRSTGKMLGLQAQEPVFDPRRTHISSSSSSSLSSFCFVAVFFKRKHSLLEGREKFIRFRK